MGIKNLLLLVIILHGMACVAQPSDRGVVYAGCTPGDGEIRQMLRIPSNTVVDFIRWNLLLRGDQQFVLDISYGQSKPNTLALKPDSIHRTIIGTYTTDLKPKTAALKETLHFSAKEGDVQFKMARVTANLFHFLTADGQWMVGNGGWSFQLNRKSPVIGDDLFIHSNLTDDTSRLMVFEGRTPCQAIASEHPEMKRSDACFKLKWKLTLHRDPVSKQPTNYVFRKVIDNEPRQVEGSWSVRKGTGALNGTVIYTVGTENPETAMSFLVGDDNILIFLDKQMKPYPGNEHFSVALNRRKE
jgi:hypothetical protein